MREQNIGKQQAPDWSRLIEDVIATGMTLAQVGSRMGTMLTTRMLRHYADGVQPVHFRGEALIGLWCDRMKRERDDVPMLEIVRGHRAARPKVVDLSPKMANAALLMQAIKPPVQRAPTSAKRKAKVVAAGSGAKIKKDYGIA